MIINKPEWVHHDADKKNLTAIFSVDINPDCTRLATAGMDNKIRVWDIETILDAENIHDNEKKKPLSVLTSHVGAVLCVRFCHGKGNKIVSGADDMSVLIWEKDEEGRVEERGNLEQVDKEMEHWRVIKRLTGHESDVVDVCWSPPDNKYLASCGLDNVVFVWDGKTFERLRKLNEHSEFVKGLSFDPAGQYLATQSDDKTLKIWRTNDWKVETTINTPFESSRYSTYFRRLKLVVPIIRLLWFDDKPWAPDGSCIVSANAVNGNTPVASVITRTGWRSELALVGHRAAIEAVKFNDQIFVADLENNKEYTTVCGIGSQDRSISVWMGIQSVPLVVVDGLFLGNIMDLSWGNLHKASGWKGLMAVCSYDGTVAILEFTKEDLKAQPVSRMEQQKVLERYHLGDKLARFNSEDARAIKKRKAWGIATLNEDTYRYDDERGESSMQGQQNTEGKELNLKNTPSGTNLELAGYTAPSTKIVVIDVDGGTENSQEPAPERISNKRAAENVEQLILEQKYHDFNKRLALEHDMQNKVESEIGMCLIDSDSVKSAGGVNNAHTSTKPAAFGGDRGSGDMLAEGKVTSVKANENTEVNQVVTRNAEGKKRVAPTFLRSLGGPSTTSSMSETTGLQSSSFSHPHSISATPNTLLQTGSVGDPGFKEKGLLSTAEAGVEAGLLKRLININQGQGTNIDGGLLIERYMRRILNMIDDQVKRKVVIPNMNVSVDINVDKKDEYANRDIGFPLPQIEKNIVRIVYNDDENTKDNTSAIEIICSNYTSSNHDSSNSSQEQDCRTIEKGGDRAETNDDSPPKHSFIAKVSAYQSSKNDEYEDKQVLWNIYSNSPITLMNTNSPKYVIFGCYDTSVNIYSIFGSRLFPPIILGSQLVILDLNTQKDNYLMAMTQNGMISVWSVLEGSASVVKAIISKVSVAPLFSGIQGDISSSTKSIKVVNGTTNSLTGEPILVLSNGNVYTYNFGCNSWLKIFDPTEHLNSKISSFHSRPNSLFSAYQLAGLLNHSHTMDTAIEHESTLDRKTTDELTLSHVESQYLNSKAFGCPEEMVYWLNLYARWLATNGSAERISALCSDLLGPPNTKGLLASSSYSTITSPTTTNSANSANSANPINSPPTCKESTTETLPISSGSMNTTSQQSGLSQSGLHSWACSLLGIPKRKLLAQILPILASERRCQTIVENYSKILDTLISSEK